jgi:hypothetical protein
VEFFTVTWDQEVPETLSAGSSPPESVRGHRRSSPRSYSYHVGSAGARGWGWLSGARTNDANQLTLVGEIYFPGGGVRSGPGEARTILLLHIISVRPSKQPLMVRTFLKVYMELGSYFLFLQEQIKDIIIMKISLPICFVLVLFLFSFE